ncbi:MAG: VVA0879 family protein, partial [Bacillota bacterium]
MTREEWYAEGRRRFGDDVMKWKFVCPACGHVASVQDYKDAGAPEGAVAFSCIGRYLPNAKQAFDPEGPGPCNYTGGGLFRLNPVRIDGIEN